jgi:hypothetical protein
MKGALMQAMGKLRPGANQQQMAQQFFPGMDRLQQQPQQQASMAPSPQSAPQQMMPQQRQQVDPRMGFRGAFGMPQNMEAIQRAMTTARGRARPASSAMASMGPRPMPMQRAMGGPTNLPMMDTKPNKPKHQRFGGGMLNSPVPGRTDKLSLAVPSGSYVVPSSVVSYLGQDNSAAGAKVLESMFGMGGQKRMGNRRFRKGTARLGRRKFAEGGDVDAPVEEVPVLAAGGEFLIPPDALIDKFGDLDHAHKIMDQFVKDTRKKHIKTLQGLPGPAK